MTYLTIIIACLSLTALAVFIAAIRVSYAIEKVTKPKARFPRYTNIWATTLGMGVDRTDRETMALLARLRRLMLIVVVLMGCMAVIAFTLQ